MHSTAVDRLGSTALWLSLLSFGVFFANVVMGGPLRMKPWLGDVAEMLMLFAAVVLFVTGTLAREAAAARRAASSPPADR